MSLHAEATIRDGLDRLRSTVALALAAVLVLIGPPTTLYPIDPILVRGPLQQVLVRPEILSDVLTRNPAALATLLVAALLALLVVLVVGILTLALALVTIRTFAADERERPHREFLTHNGPLAILNLVVGTIVYTVAVSVGLALLVAPGVYLAVSLAFWPVVVAVEDENLPGAFRRSWDLAAGNRWSILATGFGTVVVAAVISGVASLLGGGILASVGGALAWVLVLAVLVEAYRDLAGVETVAVGETAENEGSGDAGTGADDA